MSAWYLVLERNLNRKSLEITSIILIYFTASAWKGKILEEARVWTCGHFWKTRQQENTTRLPSSLALLIWERWCGVYLKWANQRARNVHVRNSVFSWLQKYFSIITLNTTLSVKQLDLRWLDISPITTVLIFCCYCYLQEAPDNGLKLQGCSTPNICASVANIISKA